MILSLAKLYSLLRTAIGVCVFVTLPAVLSAAEDAEELEREFPRSAFEVSIADLSAVEERPFMFAGRIMDEERPRWREFESALSKRPTALSCLIYADDAGPVSLLSFDWSNFTLIHEEEVCVFRVFSRFDDIKMAAAWMAWSGFSSIRTISDPDGKTPFAANGLAEPEYLYSQTGYPSGFLQRKVANLVVNAYRIGVKYNREMAIVSASFSKISK
ncbi:hypothetical protein ILP92_16280 [Maribius pontilimi]|uniref:Uncharacterized protein n=1 Tax=Palleronia pontilimi TaxID=1964209 RepID=A0A934IJX1_9RHOB|nr:hypothetical protein [Palleronia pontilimi]MBJ3764306.1 hypothetical protein [Palleronia pontilimi]